MKFYHIYLEDKCLFKNVNEEEFNIISTGNYQVSDKYSSTLKNEKRLIDDLTNDISDKIKKQINLIINDL